MSAPPRPLRGSLIKIKSSKYCLNGAAARRPGRPVASLHAAIAQQYDATHLGPGPGPRLCPSLCPPGAGTGQARGRRGRLNWGCVAFQTHESRGFDTPVPC